MELAAEGKGGRMIGKSIKSMTGAVVSSVYRSPAPGRVKGVAAQCFHENILIFGLRATVKLVAFLSKIFRSDATGVGHWEGTIAPREMSHECVFQVFRSHAFAAFQQPQGGAMKSTIIVQLL